MEEALLDHDRVHYFRGTTQAVKSAVLEDGVDVRAYFPWSQSPTSFYLNLLALMLNLFI